MSSFNGGTFLPEQLRSFADQRGIDWALSWRDDGSTDDSVALLDAFSAADPARRRRVCEPDGRIGITASFLHLLRLVPPNRIAAFADQDDEWLPDKLARGAAALAAVPPGHPALYCSRQILIDESGRPLGVSPPIGTAPRFPATLTQNLATGCTVMLNPAAVALVAGSAPPPGTLHDWWAYLLVGAVGGTLIVDPEPTVRYRQHGGNAVGAPVSPRRRAVAALRRGPDPFMRLFRSHLSALLADPAPIPPEARQVLARLDRALRGGPVRRAVALALTRGLHRRTRAETLLFRLWFLIG